MYAERKRDGGDGRKPFGVVFGTPGGNLVEIVEPIEERDEWGKFWDRLLPLKRPVRRWKTRSVEKRRRI